MTAAIEKTWATGENALSCHFTADSQTAAIALLDGTALLIDLSSGQEQRITLHPHGASLCFAPDGMGAGFLSSGDDGRVVHLLPDGRVEVVAEHKGKWIDHVAASGKLTAYAVGKLVYLSGREAPLEHPSSVGGLAFSPNGKRLAVSHYNGVSLWWSNSKEAKPQVLEWKGSHLSALWHPSGDYVMTSMQENALHGWRLKDLGELRMAGYPGKIHSMGFSFKGRWLVTSGADQIICWPFTGSGPQGKPPMVLGIPEGRSVSVVSPHPKDDMTAAGFASGRVVLALYEDRLPIELMPPDNVDVLALNWSPDGLNLIAARADGKINLFTSRSIIQASEALLNNPL